MLKLNQLLSIPRFSFARKSIFNQNKNSFLNNNSNDPEDILGEDFHVDKVDVNLREQISERKKDIFLNNKLDKSLKKRNFFDNPSLNTNRNFHLLNEIDPNELKREEKRINKIFKKFDSPEFEDYINKKSKQGFNDEDIFNELFSEKEKGKKIKFSDLENLESLGNLTKSSKSGKKDKKRKDFIDVDSAENEYSKELNEKIAMFKKELDKNNKIDENDIGAKVFFHISFIKIFPKNQI